MVSVSMIAAPYILHNLKLGIHYNSLTKFGGVDHLHATRRRVVRSDDGEIAYLQRTVM